MFRNYRFKNYNFRLIIFVVLLTIQGIAIVGSANESYQSRQIVGMVLGLVVMMVVSFIDYSFLITFEWLFYLMALVMLGLVFVPGVGYTVGGATRWILIPGGLRFQPSEMGKVFLVLFFAKYLQRYQEELNTMRRLVITAILAGVPLLLIVREPDLSTTIVTFLIIFTMMFYAGLSSKIVGTLLGTIFGGAFFGIFGTIHNFALLRGYQSDRILAWLFPERYPDKSRQQMNSIMAIGSGQMFGKGLGNEGVDSVKNGNYIPEPHTDFIFAVAGEEIGFIGSTVLIILMFAVVIACIHTATRARDLSGKLICIGMASLIGYQAFVNICVVTGLFPNTGLPLPFVSYGLTSLVTLYFGIGFVLNVSLQAKKFYEVE